MNKVKAIRRKPVEDNIDKKFLHFCLGNSFKVLTFISNFHTLQVSPLTRSSPHDKYMKLEIKSNNNKNYNLVSHQRTTNNFFYFLFRQIRHFKRQFSLSRQFPKRRGAATVTQNSGSGPPGLRLSKFFSLFCENNH